MSDRTSYHRPSTLEEALDAIASDAFLVAAGCTDIFPATERKILDGPVLDLTKIAALKGVTRNEAGVRIGATTTWSEVIRADLPRCFDGLKLAARQVGAIQIQNRGTIAGNLCNASPAADGVPPLLTLDAEVELQSMAETRRLPLSAFILGPRKTALQPGELVTAIHIPQSALRGQSHFFKLGARKFLVISIAMTAARIDVRDGVVAQAALAIGSCGPVATRAPDIERAMIGKPLDAIAVTEEEVARLIQPIDDIRADAGYRAVGAAELLRRTIEVLQ